MRERAAMALARARVSSRDVARVAGVSVNTVSLVVRGSPLVAEETRERVQAVIAQLGYRPHAAAAALRSARSQTLGYLVQRGHETLVDETYALVDIFHNQLLNAITARAQAHDHYLLIDAFVDPRRCLALLASGRIDGALVGLLIADAVLSQLLANGVPIVLVGRDAGTLPVSWVKADEEAGAYDATRHLVELGHRHLALLSVVERHHSAIVDARVHGYQRALAEAGLPFVPAGVGHGNYSFGSGYEQGRRLLEGRPRPTALFVLSELMASGVLRAAQELGLRVPDDVAIVTTEDSPMVEYSQPRLSAVHVPMYDVGLRATDVLLALLDDPKRQPQQITLPTTFVVRESSAPGGRAALASSPAYVDGPPQRPRTHHDEHQV
jgi:LacI family transcriptional regulator